MKKVLLVKRVVFWYNLSAMYSIKLYFRNRANILMLTLSLSLNIFVWFWLIFQIKPQVEPIFLHYNILFGVDYVDVWWKVFYLPIFGLILFLINTLISWWLAGHDRFIPLVINFATLLNEIFLLVAALLLVFLNF